jgi:hypothetical protein
MDWKAFASELDERGYARLPGLLSGPECRELIRLYPQRARFRSFIEMERHRFGSGDYRYFARPLPALVRALRAQLYRRLVAVANRWQKRVGEAYRYPSSLTRFTEECRRAGQTRPTALLLHYTENGFNCLHQDIYGAVAFPLQVACLLSSPLHAFSEHRAVGDSEQFTGGEFLLAEQRPRQQSRAEAIALAQGEGLVFPTRWRPIEGARGVYRAQLRHGVSRIHSGERFTLGVIFHDAR